MLLPFCKQNLKVRSSGHRMRSLRPHKIVPRDDNTVFCVRFFPSRIFETPEAQLVPGFFAERFTGRQIRAAGRHGREPTNLRNETACFQKPKENDQKILVTLLFFIIDKAASPIVCLSFHEMLWNEIGWNSDVKSGGIRTWQFDTVPLVQLYYQSKIVQWQKKTIHKATFAFACSSQFCAIVSPHLTWLQCCWLAFGIIF